MRRTNSKNIFAFIYGVPVLVSVLIIANCAFLPWKSKHPEWVDGHSTQYPDNEYIIGVGSGADRQAAEDNARAEIAKVFKACIQQRSDDFEQYLQIASDNKQKIARKLDIQQVTSITTEKVLSGISVVDNYIDESSKPPTRYALATLGRAQTQNALLEKIAGADREIMNLLSAAENATDLLSTIQNLKQAITALIVREAYNEELRVVNSLGKGKPAKVTLKALKTRLAGILMNQFNLALEIDGHYKDQILQALTEAMNRSGFVISPNPSGATVMIRGIVSVTAPDIPHPTWKFVRWRANFQLIDRRDGKIFGSVIISGKEGQLTLAAAQKRAVRIMQEKLSAGVSKELTNYIFGQQEQ